MTRFILGLLACAMLAAPTTVDAQTYPTRPLKIILPFGAGGITDLFARQIAERMAPSFGQPVIVENRPGQGGSLAPASVARAEPDGYTVLLAGSSNSIGETLFKNLSFSILKDFTPVARVTSIANVLFVHPSVKANSVQELIALAKAQPGKLTYSSSGVGGVYHLAMEMFKHQSGTDILHVPYRSETPGRNDVIAGVTNMMISAYGVTAPNIKAGQVRALAVTSSARYPQAPDLPTMAESGLPGYDGDAWIGVLAPAGTPAPIVARIHSEFAKVMRQPDFRAKLAEQGLTPLEEGPAEFAAFLKNDVEKWRKVMDVAGVKIE